MKFRKIILIVVFIGIFTIPQAANAGQVGGYEFYSPSNDWYDCYVRSADDLWYTPGHDGVTYNPAIVELTGHSFYGWYGLEYSKYVPSWMTVEVWATNMDRVRYGDYPDYMHIGGYKISTSQGGYSVTWSGHAGASGTWGDDTYTIGGNIGISWTVEGFPLNDKDLDIDEYDTVVPVEGRHLGTLMVDANEGFGSNYVDFGIILYIAIENALASYNGPYDYHKIHLKTTLYFARYRWLWPNWKRSDAAASTSHMFSIGNQNPSTDAKLYLLPAQDYNPSASPDT